MISITLRLQYATRDEPNYFATIAEIRIEGVNIADIEQQKRDTLDWFFKNRGAEGHWRITP